MPTARFSVGDAIGLPQEHIDYVLKNGGDALALTDHGNMNGVSHQQIKAAALKKKGVVFKAIPGIEAYIVDSYKDWERYYEQSKLEKKLQKESKKLQKKSGEDKGPNIGNEFKATEDELNEISSAKSSDATGTANDDSDGGTVVEDESESKHAGFDPVKQKDHLVLLPKNNDGVKSLFRLVSESYAAGYYRYPRMDMELLKKHAKGNVIGLSACLGGRLAKVIYANVADIHSVSRDNFEEVQRQLKLKIEEFVDVFGGPENYYLELQFNRISTQHLVNMHLIEASKRTGVKLVVTADSHYADPEHWKEREIYKAMAWSTKTKSAVDLATLPQRVEELKCELYPKTAQNIWDSYKQHGTEHSFYDDVVISEAIERTHDIAHNLIGDVGVDKKVKLPVLANIIPAERIEKLKEKLGEAATEDDIAYKELRRVAVEGLKWRGKASEDVYIERLAKELDDIKYLQDNSQFKFAKYFLTYKAIMDITNKHLFTGNGRGSVSGSLLAYVLNISQVDPIRFGTIWERFLNRKKLGAPDIDNDWSDRDEALQLLIQHFGEENVIPVSNFNQLQLRSLIKDVARLYQLPFAEINEATSKIEPEALAEKKKEPGFDRATWTFDYDEAVKHSKTFRELIAKYPEFQKTIQVLFKQMRNISRHAGGVIITNDSFSGMPVIKAGGELQTPWPEGINYRHLEEFGLLKFDILGLGTLRMFEQVIRKILIKQGNRTPSFEQVKEWFWNNLHPDNNDFDDLRVYKNVFWEKRYAGVFQFVQDNVQNFMAEMRPTSIMDIAVATSIFRPGPLNEGVDKKYLNNRNNPEQVVYKHPLLKEVFADTAGLLVFQEQLQMIYNKLGGIPLEDTDGVRKAFTKKDKDNTEKQAAARKELRDKFLVLCKQANGISEDVSAELFDSMEKLVAYSFNKSHAIAYAITSYQCAWFLTYYPDEWVTTYLDYCAISKGKASGKESPVTIAYKEVKRLGYTIEKTDINNSEYEFAVSQTKPKTIVTSFASVKGIGKAATYELKNYRPYTSLKELLVNKDYSWKHTKFNKGSLTSLVLLEGLDSVDIVGPGKTFDNYKQVEYALIQNFDKLRTAAEKQFKLEQFKLLEASGLLKKKARKPKETESFDEVLAALVVEAKQKCPDPWTDEEKIENQKTIAGTVDFSIIISDETQEELDQLGFESIDEVAEREPDPGDKKGDIGGCWAVISTAVIAKTKTGKSYLKLKVFAQSNKEYTIFIWNYNKSTVNLKPNDVIVVKHLSKSKFGLSAFPNAILKLNK